MSINETVTTLASIHQALQQGAINEAALLTMEALEAARVEEEAYEEYLEARELEAAAAGSLWDSGWLGQSANTEDVPF